MKRTELIQKTKERLSILPQEVAVVVNYKGKKHSIIPYEFNNPIILKRLTMNDIRPFLNGEIVEEQKEIWTESPDRQFFTFRAEAAIDAWSFANKCSENFENIQFHTFTIGEKPLFDDNFGKICAPSNLSLIEVKTSMWELAHKYEIADVHVLIESLDYPIFEGLRDRDSPNLFR